MRTIALALVLGFFAAGTASAAPRHHAKRHHARAVKHAKAKTHHAVKRA